MTLLRRGTLGTVFGLLIVAGTAQAGGGGAPIPRQVVCAPGYVRPHFSALERELAAARARWAGARPDAYWYDFEQVAAPVMFPPVRVAVGDGVVREVLLLVEGGGPPPPLARATVEERFDQVAQTLAAGRGQPCPLVEAEYDPRLGYPIRLYSGSSEANIADGWGEWRVTNFSLLAEALPGSP